MAKRKSSPTREEQSREVDGCWRWLESRAAELYSGMDRETLDLTILNPLRTGEKVYPTRKELKVSDLDPYVSLGIAVVLNAVTTIARFTGQIGTLKDYPNIWLINAVRRTKSFGQAADDLQTSPTRLRAEFQKRGLEWRDFATHSCKGGRPRGSRNVKR